MKSSIIVIFFALVLTTQVFPCKVSITEPNGASVWIANKSATVSWVTPCNNVPNCVLHISLAWEKDEPFSYPPPLSNTIGLVDCSKDGSTQVQVPPSIPQRSNYTAFVYNSSFPECCLSISDEFMILNPALNPLPTPTGKTTGPNGGAIGGGVAGAAVIVAALSGFFYVRRRKTSAERTENDSKEAEAGYVSQVSQKQHIDQVTEFSNYSTVVKDSAAEISSYIGHQQHISPLVPDSTMLQQQQLQQKVEPQQQFVTPFSQLGTTIHQSPPVHQHGNLAAQQELQHQFKFSTHPRPNVVTTISDASAMDPSSGGPTYWEPKPFVPPATHPSS